MKNTKSRKQASLSISNETKGLLDSIKHPGQSYNGLIQELIRFWEKEHGVEENKVVQKDAEERLIEAKI